MTGELAIEENAPALWPEDPEQARKMVTSTAPALYRFLFGMLGSAPEAEDILQETYLSAQRSTARYRGESSLLSWLTGIALNLARHRIRRRRSERRFLRLVRLFGPGEPPESAVERREEEDRVRLAVAALPERERAVLSMFDWEGLSHREIARVLGCAEGTVWSLLSRARAEVRRRLGDER